MPVTAGNTKPKDPRSQRSLRVIEPPIEPSAERLTRPGALELLRVSAGLSYGDIARLLGVRRARIVRLMRGSATRPPWASVEPVLHLLWERMPIRPARLRIPARAAFLTLPEAARMLALKPAEVRRLICRHREIGAIKVGSTIRIPRRGLTDFLCEPQREGGKPRGLTRQELASLLRVEVSAIRYANRMGQIRFTQRGHHYPVLIPTREVQRLLRQGTQELRPRRSDLPKSERGKSSR